MNVQLNVTAYSTEEMKLSAQLPQWSFLAISTQGDAYGLQSPEAEKQKRRSGGQT